MILIKIIYSLLVNIRNFMYDKKIIPIYQSKIPVISIGNITTGGAGKTPFVIFLANYLKGLGRQPLIISRGYKRQSTQQILITKNHKYTAKEIGDEPLLISLMCKGVDVLVNKKRANAVRWAEKQDKKYDCIILDDAFQHRSVHRVFDILLINALQNMNSYPPKGALREPFKNVQRADCLIITKGHDTKSLSSWTDRFKGPVFRADSSFQTIGNKNIKQGVSFCGIAGPHLFLETLNLLGINSKDHIDFKDHQKYDEKTLDSIERMLQKNNETAFFTTFKDWVKLPKKFLNKYTGVCVDMSLSIDRTADWERFKKMLSIRLQQ